MRRTLGRVFALADKEVRHVVRDPRSLYLALGMPAVLLLLFGFGISFDLDHMPIGFVDHDASPDSRRIRYALVSAVDFDDAGISESVVEAERRLVAGEVACVVIFPPGFGERLRRGDPSPVQLLVDGADNSTAVQVSGKLEAGLRVLGVDASPAMGAMRPPIDVRPFMRFNPEARSAVFLVPGIAAYVLAIVAVLLTALTVAREWERGSMAQLFATPVGRLEIVIGKLLPYLVLATLAVLLVIAVGTTVFDVPLRGSVIALAVISLLFLTGMLAQGLVISVITKNQMVATQAATLSSMLPSMLLSGFVFPIENMPAPLQLLSRVIPARYMVDGLRAVMLRGNGLETLWPDALALAVFAFVMIAISTARFSRVIA
ncbi:MAG: ABC transporter permease [Sandaracinaceae bacterium]